MISWGLIILYILSCIAFITYLFFRKTIVAAVCRVLFSLSVAAHLALILSLWARTGVLPLSSPFQAAGMMIFLASLVFIPFVFRKTTAVLGAFFVPVACFGLGFIVPFLDTGRTVSEAASRIWYPLHTLSVIGGEALFASAFVVSAVYLVHERTIRKGNIHSRVLHLPPLKYLDLILSYLLSAGFVAITAGMIFGALWASNISLPLAHLATKASAGALTWLVFAFSLHQRFAIGWKGKRTAIITIIGFTLMIILFVGMNLMYPDAHGIRLTT